MGTRKANRLQLATLMTANGSFNVVNGFAPKDLNGATKVLNIYSTGTRLDDMSEHMKDDFYEFSLDVLVLRTGLVADENTLDDLQAAVRSVVEANHQLDTYWNELDLTGSTPFFSELSGQSYRGERHTVLMKVSNTS